MCPVVKSWNRACDDPVVANCTQSIEFTQVVGILLSVAGSSIPHLGGHGLNSQ
jgi:hypothetical protein